MQRSWHLPEKKKICWTNSKIIQLYQVCLQEVNSIIEKMWPNKHADLPSYQRIGNLYKTQEKYKE